MINELRQAIVEQLKIDGVQDCKQYAGELEGQIDGALRTPAILINFEKIVIKDAPGEEENLTGVQSISAWLIAKHARGSENRGKTVDALVEAAVVKIHNNNFLVSGASGSSLKTVVPNYSFEGKGFAVREIKWEQEITLNEHSWDGEAEASELVFNDEVINQEEP